MTDATTNAPLAVLPFQDMTRDDMLAHLKEYHDFDATRRDAKVTKDNLINQHLIRHQAGWSVAIEHEHKALDANDLAEAGDLVRSLEKPLTVAERNALKALIVNDFDSLSKEIDATSGRLLRERGDQVTADYADKKVAAEGISNALSDATKDLADAIRVVQVNHNDALAAAKADAEKAVQAIKDKATTQGVSVKGAEVSDRYSLPSISGWEVDAEGEQAARQQATMEVRREAAAAHLAADRQRLAVERQIMLAAIPEAIRPLVDAIPNAKALLAQVTKADKQIEA